MEFRPTVAEIDLSAIAQNLSVIRERWGGDWLCPMIKANAYGHGALEVARCLERHGVSRLGVALVEEGVAVRERLSPNTEIFVFGFFSEASLSACAKYRLTPVLGDPESLRRLASLDLGSRPPSVHVKFNTGMQRLGFSPSEAEQVARQMASIQNVKCTGVCTHLTEGEDLAASNSVSAQQLEGLLAVMAPFAKWSPTPHALNTSAIFSGQAKTHWRHIGARPGLSLYGYDGLWPQASSLRPAMSLRSRVQHLHFVPTGAGVSYNRRWRASRDSWVAVVPVGYADGVPRQASGRAEVLIAGQRLPVVGTICMDYLMVDVTELIKKFKNPGDVLHLEVLLWGTTSDARASLSAAEVADWAGTVPYQILVGLGARVERLFVGGPA